MLEQSLKFKIEFVKFVLSISLFDIFSFFGVSLKAKDLFKFFMLFIILSDSLSNFIGEEISFISFF
jgi:hypothetical protein